MEASSSSQPPDTPTHPSLLPALSPAFEQTPTMLHSLPPHLFSQTPTHLHSHTPMHGLMQPPPPRPAFFPQNTPGNVPSDGNVFGSVMGGSGSGSGAGKRGTIQASPSGSGLPIAGSVYASVYSGIPVYEAMIRGISVMRRTADSWVNATQILKVAGIPKTQRTKILERDILRGEHEKVQGGYGKYQGTWIPFARGQELADQYGCSDYLSPIFDFIPHGASAPTALPLARNPSAEAQAQSSGATYQMYQHHDLINQNPPYPGQPHTAYLPYPPAQYHPQGGLPPHGLAPAHTIQGMGLPASRSDVYIDQYGQPHPTYQAQIARQQFTPTEEPTYPAKRQRSDEAYSNGHDDTADVEPIEVDDEDVESSDEIVDAPPLPTAMRLANKPLRPKPNALALKTRTRLLNLFSSTSPEDLDVRSALGIDPDSDAPLQFDIDMVIDSQGHTALHWACSLARTEVAIQLIELGADIHHGNYAGETPLIRTVLTTNHAESGTFPQMLEHVSPSIRTLDQAYRSVLHHIALVAGLKGRASSARVYMAGILEWVARGNVGNVGIKNLVDVQDVHGDTALNVAARVGNRGLVKLLLDAGADKSRANKLGLRPADYGVEVEALAVSPGEAVVSSMKSEAAKPERQSKDVQKNIAAIFETINDTFAAEMTAKQTAFNNAEQSVRSATRILAERRMQIHRAQSAVSELEQTRQKIEAIRIAIPLIERQDWTGRTRLSGENVPPPAFRPVDGASGRLGSTGDVGLPSRGEVGGLEKLRRMAIWEDRIMCLLDDRMRTLVGDSAERAVKYRRLVSLCAKVPVDKVDSMLGELTSAIESDGQGLDLSRISQFMARMKEAGESNGNGEAKSMS